MFSSSPLPACSLLSLPRKKGGGEESTPTHPHEFATKLIPSVAFFVNTTSLSLAALTNLATLARADS